MRLLLAVVASACLLIAKSDANKSGRVFTPRSQLAIAGEEGELSQALFLRGGAKAAKVNSLNERKSTLKAAKELIADVKPATRLYMALCIFCTLIHITGLPAPALFNLDKSRILEIWRPFTAMAYLGGPSMSMANNAYFLVRYGQQLETENGLGAHAWFLLVQTAILSTLGLLLGFPFMAQAMIAATVYVSSHQHPLERMPFQFGMMITSWQLPFAMMGIDCLSQQNMAAAWPHVLGIFSGHCYHFFNKVWPALGGRAWLQPPKWILNKLGDKPRSNVAGIDFRGIGDEKKGGATKKRKGGKGRKLGDLPTAPSPQQVKAKATTKSSPASKGSGSSIGGVKAKKVEVEEEED